jgi:flagellar P-ring protein FlgI
MMKTIAAAVALSLGIAAGNANAQSGKVSDFTTMEGEAPVRLVGYGLVVGLDGTGDRAIGGFGSRHTVQSVANLLRNFDIDVPAELLRTRNVAAVLVTAEASPYLRKGGRFDVNVASIGDASSLRGGTLWATPLLPATGGAPLGIAQGNLLVAAQRSQRDASSVETGARVPQGALLSSDMRRPNFAQSNRLLLTVPDLDMANRIAEAINTGIAAKTATVEDPGSLVLTLADTSSSRSSLLARIANIKVDGVARSEIIINSRDGTVVAGADLTVAPVTVSHDGITLTVGAASNGASTATTNAAGQPLTFVSGASIRDIAAALQSIGAPSRTIAAVFESLHKVGAIAAVVKVQ